MYDQSINQISLSKTLRRSDFHIVFDLRDESKREQILFQSVATASTGAWSLSPLKISQLRGKNVYSLPKFSDELLVRKINNNIRYFRRLRNPARTSIVTNLARVTAEAVPYKLYRLDVKSFFESFSVSHVLTTIDNIEALSLSTKRLLRDLFKHFSDSGGTGIPRGLAISSTLSELMMHDFDLVIKNKKNVFFYARYVDDIILVTSGQEVETDFIKEIEKLLPDGLKLSKKKQEITTVSKTTKTSSCVFHFEYLGYKFKVTDPKALKTFRHVELGIATNKIKKIKTKIVLAMNDFCGTHDISLFRMRLQFLCGNFSLNDRDLSRNRLAGIYYNYHLIHNKSEDSGLVELDKFLKKTMFSNYGRVFSSFHDKTTTSQRRELTKLSFQAGFESKSFLHYSKSKLVLIQKCWKYV
ncbi:MAG: RNA-directed DNA polymerase [Pseudomonadota bacterium]|nr:RNA-directed DNA polymerase [Pseudomonadota bacterium]